MAGDSVNEKSLDEVEHAMSTCKTVAEMIDLTTKELEQLRILAGATGESYFKDEIIETEVSPHLAFR